MQFIVKPQKNLLRTVFNSTRDLERSASRLLLLLGLAGCFSTGLLIGSLSNFDSSSCSSTNSLSLHSGEDIRKEDTFLIVLILSAKHLKERRDAIRQSWLKLQGARRVKYFFVLGSLELEPHEVEALHEENNVHQDLLTLPNVKDTYSGLTSKVLAALRHVHHHYNFELLVKVDDDSFVRLDALYDELLHTKDTRRLYWGYFVANSQVKSKGQWAEKQWFLSDRYLPYAVGGGN